MFSKNDDDIPEMKFPKKEPKTYYDKKLKVWMIEGQEEEIMKQLEKKNAPPPKIDQQQDAKSDIVSGRKVGSKKIMKRYANILGSENLIENKSDAVRNDDTISEIVPEPKIQDEATVRIHLKN